MSTNNQSPNLPKVLGITGGIGSGKSIISKLFRLTGIPVYDCDREAKRLNNTNKSIQRELCSLVGKNAYNIDGTLNKQVLAKYLFENSTNAMRVNAIIHPHVMKDFIHWREQQKTQWVGIESAILFETGFNSITDKTLMVYASEETKIARIIRRDGTTIQNARLRIAQQMSDEEKQKKADWTIQNDNTSPIIPHFLDILAFLLCTSQN